MEEIKIYKYNIVTKFYNGLSKKDWQNNYGTMTSLVKITNNRQIAIHLGISEDEVISFVEIKEN